jgi:hypothetical protein
MGTVTWDSMDNSDVKGAGSWDLMLSVCKGEIRIWSGSTPGKYDAMDANLSVVTSPDSILIYFTNMSEHQPNWVEFQTFSVMRANEKTASLVWSRAVNNRGSKPEAANRMFFERGFGTLTRDFTECEHTKSH